MNLPTAYIEATQESAERILKMAGYPDILINGYAVEHCTWSGGMAWGSPHIQVRSDTGYLFWLELEELIPELPAYHKDLLLFVAVCKSLCDHLGKNTDLERGLIREWAHREVTCLNPQYLAGMKQYLGGKKGRKIKAQREKEEIESRNKRIALKAMGYLADGRTKPRELCGKLVNWGNLKEDNWPATTKQIRTILKQLGIWQALHQESENKREVLS